MIFPVDIAEECRKVTLGEYVVRVGTLATPHYWRDAPWKPNKTQLNVSNAGNKKKFSFPMATCVLELSAQIIRHSSLRCDYFETLCKVHMTPSRKIGQAHGKGPGEDLMWPSHTDSMEVTRLLTPPSPGLQGG